MRILDYYHLQPIQEKEIGIEIEMEGEKLFRGPFTYWRTKIEYSLRGEGVEYVSRTPFSRGEVSARLKGLQSLLEKRNSILLPSERCGVHIHINCQQLTMQQLFNYIGLYLILESLLVKFCGPSREGNLFCLRSEDAEEFIVALIDCYIKKNLSMLTDDDFRYSSINVKSIRTFGSLEFRAFRTPVNFSEINPWIVMLLAIKDKSLQYNNLKEIVEDFSGMGAKRFIINVLNKKMYNVLSCLDEDRLVMEGVRRVQNVAYSRE